MAVSKGNVVCIDKAPIIRLPVCTSLHLKLKPCSGNSEGSSAADSLTSSSVFVSLG